MLYVILCALLLGAAAGRRSPGLDATHASEQRHPRLTQDTIPLPIMCDVRDLAIRGIRLGVLSPRPAPNKRLKLAVARRLRNEFFFSAPQLKRDSLGSRTRHAPNVRGFLGR